MISLFKWHFSFLIIHFVIISTMAGCSYSGIPNNTWPVKHIAQGYKGITQEIAKSDFQCAANTAPCPNNVGLVLSNDDGKETNPSMAGCTGFIAETDNIIGTNSHCIPDHVKKNPSACPSSIAIRFIDNGTMRIFACKELITFSTEPKGQRDYAFFRIQKTGLPPIPIARNELKDNQPLNIFKVTPMDDGSKGQPRMRLEKETCKVTMRSTLNPTASYPWTATGLVTGCSVRGGNSGSPLLNESHQAIGMIQSTYENEDDLRQALEAAFSPVSLIFPQSIVANGVFTAFSCMNAPQYGYPSSKNCRDLDYLETMECPKKYRPAPMERHLAIQSKMLDLLPPVFSYDVAEAPTGLFIAALPNCVDTRHVSQYSSVPKGVQTPVGTKIEVRFGALAIFAPEFQLDEKYRLSPHNQLKKRYNLDYIASLTKTATHWEASLKRAPAYGFDPDSNKFPVSFEGEISLPDCEMKSPLPTFQWKRVSENGDVIEKSEYLADLAKKPAPSCAL